MPEKHYDPASGKALHSLLSFFWPLLLTNMLQGLYSAVDMAVVGRFVGEAGLAAVSNAAMPVFVMTAIGIGVTTGGTVLAARYAGAGENARLKDAADSTLSLAAGISFPVTATMLITGEKLFHIVKVPAEAMPDAVEYIRIVSTGMFFVFTYNAASAILRGMGDSRSPLRHAAVAAGINITLDLILAGPLAMGVAGTAYATVVAQAVAAGVSLLRLYRHNLGNRPAWPGFSCPETAAILKIGIPVAVQLAVVNISYLIVNGMLNRYGVTVAAAAGIGLKINTLAAMPCWAMGSAITAMTGQCLGARNHERAEQVLRAGLLANLTVSLAVAAAANIFAEGIIGAFIPDDPEVTAVGVAYLRICCSANSLVYCAMYAYDAFAVGAGAASLAMFNSLLDSVMARITLSWLLGVRLDYGFLGIFVAQALSPVLPAIVGAVYFHKKYWRRPTPDKPS